MILPITLTMAGAAALLSVWLALRVSHLRRKHHVSISDGGNAAVATRMRAHANFAEYTPIFLILLGLIEAARGSETWLWAVALLFVLARVAHMFGMDRPAPNALRMGGAGVTWVVLLGLGAYAIAIPYLEQRKAPSIQYAQASFSAPEGTKLN